MSWAVERWPRFYHSHHIRVDSALMLLTVLPQTFAELFAHIGVGLDEAVRVAGVLLKIGVVFFLLTEILKRLPLDPNRHNVRLAHTEKPFFNDEIVTELSFAIIAGVLFMPLSALVMYVLYEGLLTPVLPQQPLDPWVQTLPFWLQVVLGLFVLDLSLYIRHRFVHVFVWPYHAVHHAARQITWITWMRLHPIDHIVMSAIGAIIVHLLGFSGEAFASAFLLFTYANMFNHSNIQLDYPAPLRYIFVSPNMHRWHHATEPEAQMKNFCIFFSFIDVIFGTFYVPQNQLPKRYGVLDEDGNDVAKPDFVSQLLYPFQENWRWVRSKLGGGHPTDDSDSDTGDDAAVATG